MVMIPRSNTAGTDATDGPDLTKPLPLELDSMMKAIPKGGSQRQKIKSRDWKSSVDVYNNL